MMRITYEYNSVSDGARVLVRASVCLDGQIVFRTGWGDKATVQKQAEAWINSNVHVARGDEVISAQG